MISIKYKLFIHKITSAPKRFIPIWETYEFKNPTTVFVKDLRKTQYVKDGNGYLVDCIATASLLKDAGQMFYEQQDKEKALELLVRALNFNPFDADIWTALMILYREKHMEAEHDHCETQLMYILSPKRKRPHRANKA